MVRLTLDGHQIEAAAGKTILQAAENIGIEIPNLCYMKELMPEGMCRLCVVEVEGARNLVPACGAMVAEGMVIQTKSARVVNARREILELMISDHNADCFTCYKHGSCLFNKYCMEYGVSKEYGSMPALKPIDCSNPFYDFDPNKCILCRRCTRTCQHLQCVEALAVCERGPSCHIAPAFDMPLAESPCVSCGNCVAQCPTGALSPKNKTSRVYTKSTRTVCGYCGVGCQLELLTNGNQVVGSVPADGPANHGMLCVKGRFAYDFINHKARLTQPLVRKDNRLQEATWEEAYACIAEHFLQAAAKQGETPAIAGLASARCTNEENYLFQKMLRGLGHTNHIDHCARL